MSVATNLLLLGALALPAASGNSLTIVNPLLANVAIQCSPDYAYQEAGVTCTDSDSDAPYQDFNAGLGIGWIFASHAASPTYRDGLTKAGTLFDPPPFPSEFSQAAFLQIQSAVSQTITGFVPGGSYTLSFYLGSRYGSGCCSYGNQTVQVSTNNQVIGTWNLVSDTAGTNTSGDNTAFFSDVTLETTSTGLAVTPSIGLPGLGFSASAGGFSPLETVTLTAYANAPVVIATGTANASGVTSLEGHLPQTPFGALGLQAIGQSSGTVVFGLISLRPRISVTPANGAAGATVRVTGFGYAAGEEVNLEWSNPQTSLGSATANKNGTFSAEVIIPSGASVGADELVATGQRTGAAGRAQITVP